MGFVGMLPLFSGCRGSVMQYGHPIEQPCDHPASAPRVSAIGVVLSAPAAVVIGQSGLADARRKARTKARLAASSRRSHVDVRPAGTLGAKASRALAAYALRAAGPLVGAGARGLQAVAVEGKAGGVAVNRVPRRGDDEAGMADGDSDEGGQREESAQKHGG